VPHLRCAQDDDETRLRLEGDDLLVEGETVGYVTRGRERSNGERGAFFFGLVEGGGAGSGGGDFEVIDLVGEAVGG